MPYGRLQPIYESAVTQGYDIWDNKVKKRLATVRRTLYEIKEQFTDT